MTDSTGDPGRRDQRPAVSGDVQEPWAGWERGRFRAEGHVWTWDDEDVRRGLPWFGVFLVAFGAILLVGQAFPRAHIVGSGFATAVGVALLISWATHRSWGLYPGLLITAISLPSLLVDLGAIPAASGYGTLFLGIGLLVVAGMRWRALGTWGWQLVLGGLLAIAGGSDVADQVWSGGPRFGDLLGPLLLVLLGAIILTRGVRRS